MTSNRNADLSKEIKRLLGDRTQDWLAVASGVGQSTISRLLRGVYTPDPKTLERLAPALGVDPARLMALAGFPVSTKNLDPHAAYIAARLSELPSEVRDYAIDAVSAVVDAWSRQVEGKPANGRFREEQEIEPEPIPLDVLEAVVNRLDPALGRQVLAAFGQEELEGVTQNGEEGQRRE